ncbi:unnamed protein product [Mytilus edulis]|uniref:Uncharacterized protein n=1 Tax=Mytilus edulis TaxID=6550 RepID=A0A8S3QHS0_MYTED|nr:unnamed protein product [Mytilus edulis]
MKGTTEKVFHINILKLWYEKSDDLESSKTEVLACLDIISSLSSTDDEVDTDFNAKVVPVIEAKETIDDVTISEKLSVENKQQLATQRSEVDRKTKQVLVWLSELEFLGHIAGNDTIKPVQDKVSAIREFPVPTTKKNVRSFLGLIGFYRKLIPKFA